MKRVVVLMLAVALLTGCGPDHDAPPPSGTSIGPSLTECRDGAHTTSTGRGTCSGHGGVKRMGDGDS